MSCLNLAEPAHDLWHGSPHIDRGTENLSCCGINPTGTLSTAPISRYITNGAIFKVVFIKVRIVRWILFDGYHILETNTLKSIIPIEYSLAQRFLPGLGESVVDKKNDLFLWRDKFTSGPCVEIGRLYTPTFNIVNILNVVRSVEVNRFLLCREKTNTGISKSGIFCSGNNSRLLRISAEQFLGSWRSD